MPRRSGVDAPPSTDAQVATLAAGLLYIAAISAIAGWLATGAPWGLAVLGLLLLVVQRTRFAPTGVLKRIAYVFGFGLLVSGLCLGLATV